MTDLPLDLDGPVVESVRHLRQFCARDELRYHRDGAAGWHGVLCVQNDIEQDLTEVSFVHQDGEPLTVRTTIEMSSGRSRRYDLTSARRNASSSTRVGWFNSGRLNANS
jgi:hypothetical protein